MNAEKVTVLLEDIKKDYAALKKMTAAKGKKKIVVDAGLLKAGKSSLFNALAGKELFTTDVVRATVENQKVELDGYILLDTPGLDARDEDTNVALEGYETADVILFVHNLQEGEFSQREIDSIEQIADLFGDKEKFFKNVILVLTHKDQVEENYKVICKQISEQCKKVLGYQFIQTFCVDSVGYMKGLLEDKKLLMKDSGIPELHEAVKHCVNDEFDLRQARLNKCKKQCVANIAQAIAAVRADMPKEVADQTAKWKKLKINVESIVNEEISKIKEEKLFFLDLGKGIFSCYAGSRTGRRYSSESRARSAAMDAINAMFRNANERMHRLAKNVVERAEYYVELSGKASSIKNSFADSYEKIREEAKNQNILLKTNFDMVLNDFATSNTKREIDSLKYSARNISDFSCSPYSSYIYIDYDYETEWVQGLFGTKEKQVKVYEYDAKDAIDEVDYDMREQLKDLESDARSAVSTVFEKIKDDLCKQFNVLSFKILKEIDDAIKQEEEKQKAVNNALNQAKQTIAELEGYKRNIEAL